MRAVLDIVLLVLQIYIWLLIAAAVLSWLVAFNVVNTRNQVVHMVGDFLYRLTEPLLRPIRYAAQSRRHRRFAGNSDPADPVPGKRDRPLRLSERLSDVA